MKGQQAPRAAWRRGGAHPDGSGAAKPPKHAAPSGAAGLLERGRAQAAFLSPGGTAPARAPGLAPGGYTRASCLRPSAPQPWHRQPAGMCPRPRGWLGLRRGLQPPRATRSGARWGVEGAPARGGGWSSRSPGRRPRTSEAELDLSVAAARQVANPLHADAQHHGAAVSPPPPLPRLPACSLRLRPARGPALPVTPPRTRPAGSAACAPPQPHGLSAPPRPRGQALPRAPAALGRVGCRALPVILPLLPGAPG